MPIFKLNRRALSFQAMTNRLPAMTDPLEFLNSVGSTIPVRDAYQQIHGAIHASLSDVERSVQAVFERLGPESTITERMIQDANDDIRTDLALASTFADAKRDELILETVARVERLYIQRLIVSSGQEPPVRRWNDLADRAIRRDLPPVSEPGQTHLHVPPSERRKRLARWRAEPTNGWKPVPEPCGRSHTDSSGGGHRIYRYLERVGLRVKTPLQCGRAAIPAGSGRRILDLPERRPNGQEPSRRGTGPGHLGPYL